MKVLLTIDVYDKQRSGSDNRERADYAETALVTAGVRFERHGYKFYVLSEPSVQAARMVAADFKANVTR